MTGQDSPQTASELLLGLEKVKERLEAERCGQFLSFGIASDCYWPASRVYHRHSIMGPQTKLRMTQEELIAFTNRLDYKRYPGAIPIPLPRADRLTLCLEDLIRERRSDAAFSERPIALKALSKLLELGCGVTDRQQVPRRAAPSAGALYPVEVYPLAFSVEGLAPGIYHYAGLDHVLEPVRPANVDVLGAFLSPMLSQARPALVLALSAIFPRVQTKYLERGYRFALIEAGHIAQNILLTATALGLNAVPAGGFWDEPFNALMGFEPDTEAVVYSIVLGNRG